MKQLTNNRLTKTYKVCDLENSVMPT